MKRIRHELEGISDAIKKAKVTRPTLINWIKNYTVEGNPLGIKVGGRWKVYPEALDKFLSGVREKRPIPLEA